MEGGEGDDPYDFAKSETEGEEGTSAIVGSGWVRVNVLFDYMWITFYKRLYYFAQTVIFYVFGNQCLLL